MAVTEDDVRRALGSVPAPDGSANLSQSPALSKIAVMPGGRVIFSIETTPERAAALEPVRRAAEAAVRAVPGVSDVLVALTAEKEPGAAAPQPVQTQSPMMGRSPRAAAPGVASPARPAGATNDGGVPGVKHIIAVASGKGGVGKSTTAANLALALAAKGLKIGVLDADVYGPSMPTLFALDRRPEVEGKQMKPLQAHGLKIMSIGFLVDPGQAMIWRGPMVMSALTQMLSEVAWGELDVLVVDMPPGTGDAQLTMAQRVKLSGSVIVSTPQDLALADARRGVAMFRKVEVPILGIVENMSYYCCPECGHRANLFGHGGARAEAQAMSAPFLGEIPLSLQIRETSDAGAPIVVSAPESEDAKAYGRIADAVWTRLTEGVDKRQGPRIVIER